jgi:hypothetical protein
MYQYSDLVEFYIRVINALRSERINAHSPLHEIVVKSCKNCFAYIDNRRDAKEKYDYDIWESIKNRFREEREFIRRVKTMGIGRGLLYSKSEQFPDFLFKVRKRVGKLICGSLLELKDSKGGSIASFNSTLPTKYKTLEEVNIINGNNLVSKIASIIDGSLASERGYHTFERRCFYFVRTHADKDNKVKISIVDGSFFETVPKEHLIYQMFLKILNAHLEKKEIKMSPDTLGQIQKALSHVTDQTIIAASQIIEKASVRPRLRIMAEVHSEGNPHSSFYPQILERSLNFIIDASVCNETLIKRISQAVPQVNIFTIRHRRNGEHMVFQFRF